MATGCSLLLASAKPSYKFAYGVHDPNTGDVKEQQEYKDDDNRLHGYYKTLDADGLMRTVTYQSHPSTGFEAHVEREPYSTPDNTPIVVSRSGAGYDEPSLITRPAAWSVNMVHRIDPAAAPDPSTVLQQQQEPDIIPYEAPIYQEPAALMDAGAYVETKTTSAVIHPSPIAIAAATIPQYDSQSYSPMSQQSYSPGYQYYFTGNTPPPYFSQSSRTFSAGTLQNLGAESQYQYAPAQSYLAGQQQPYYSGTGPAESADPSLVDAPQYNTEADAQPCE